MYGGEDESTNGIAGRSLAYLCRLCQTAFILVDVRAVRIQLVKLNMSVML